MICFGIRAASGYRRNNCVSDFSAEFRRQEVAGGSLGIEARTMLTDQCHPFVLVWDFPTRLSGKWSSLQLSGRHGDRGPTVWALVSEVEEKPTNP